jgi:hypothetical protein
MKDCENRHPIFIVGAPRSGTTLLAAMLAAHSRLSCGPETRFFRFLANADPGKLIDSESWPGKALEYLFSVKLVDVPVPQHYGLSREEIFGYLEKRPPDIPSILSALTEQYMLREGKSRWIEKSPEHLKCVRDIRKYFPNSPIIRIIRDPRDVALSLQKVPWARRDFLENLMLWRDYDDCSAAFFREDGNCQTVYYENLVQTPIPELKQLCAFLGEEFEYQMLETSRSAGNVIAENETWHRIVHRPVDRNRVGVWKRELPKELNRVAEALIGDRLIKYGYKNSERFDHHAIIYPSLFLLLKHRQVLESFADEGIRFWGTDHNDEGKILIYIGEPDKDKWLRHKKPGRWWDAIHILARILLGNIANRRIYWLNDGKTSVDSGYCSRLITFVLHQIGYSQPIGQKIKIRKRPTYPVHKT